MLYSRSVSIVIARKARDVSFSGSSEKRDALTSSSSKPSYTQFGETSDPEVSEERNQGSIP